MTAASGTGQGAGLRWFRPGLVAIAGAFLLAVAALAVARHNADPYLGSGLYDAYFRAILDGRLDLPPRLLMFEGHYAPDGTGYLYHGVAPLLTRFVAGWVWPFDSWSMAGVSIWFWSVLGTLFYQTALLDLLRGAGGLGTAAGQVWTMAFCLALWVGGPAILLVVNQALFHEAASVAYAMTAGFVLAWVRMSTGALRIGPALGLLALCAAIALHARPNFAPGLYVGVVLAVGLALRRHGRQALLPAALAGALLLAGGAGFLGLNALRFGAATDTHGSFETGGVQYGMTFWGEEAPDSDRAQAFIDHGRFNIRRILPNAAMYLADLPMRGVTTGLSTGLLDWYRSVTLDRLGEIRVEFPRMGILYLWPGWIVLAICGIAALRRQGALALLLVPLALVALLTLSYGTITLRYRFDVWPVVVVAAIFGLAAVTPWLAAGPPLSFGRLAAIGLMCAGVAATLLTGRMYFWYQTEAPWSFETCVAKSERAGLPADRIPHICRSPYGDES